MDTIGFTEVLVKRLSSRTIRHLTRELNLDSDLSENELRKKLCNLFGSKIKQKVSMNFSLNLPDWNLIIRDLGGNARRSFDDAKKEIARLAAEIRNEELSGREFGEIKPSNMNTSETDRNLYFGLISTRVSGSGVGKLNMDLLHDFFCNAQEISIASGFYDKDFLDELIERCKKARSIRLVFNGLGGLRLDDQKIILSALESSQVQVRLSFAPGMFHSKLYISQDTEGCSRSLIGSANATNAALDRNEEILLCVENRHLLDYFQMVWEKAVPISHVSNINPRSLVAFFRSGVLYFRSLVNLNLTLNPFVGLFDIISDEDKRKLGGAKLRYAEIKTSVIGGFSVKSAIEDLLPSPSAIDTELKYDNSQELEDENFDDEEIDMNDISNNKARVPLKKYSIETCYGYWVPSHFDADFQSKFRASRRQKEEEWKIFLQTMDCNRSKINERYKYYLSDVKDLFNSQGIAVEDYIAKLSFDPFDSEVIDGFIDKIFRHLSNDKNLAHLSSRFVSGVVPELWDDADAYNDFSESFFRYVERYIFSKRKPLAVKYILDFVGHISFDYRKPELWSDLRQEFEDHIEANGIL